MNPRDRLDLIEHLISVRNIHADDQELFKLILEELRMLRGYTMEHTLIVDCKEGTGVEMAEAANMPKLLIEMIPMLGRTLPHCSDKGCGLDASVYITTDGERKPWCTGHAHCEMSAWMMHELLKKNFPIGQSVGI